jgi:hypothetical protein
MNIILGFGITEEQERAKIKEALDECLSKGESPTKVLDKWNMAADKYDKMPRNVAPERYTRFWYYDDKLVFHHINRNHALSPDGWGLWVFEEEYGEV